MCYLKTRFGVGICERWDKGRLQVCKVTFGPEPRDAEIYAFILAHWDTLQFSPAIKADAKPSAHKKPQASPARNTKAAGPRRGGYQSPTGIKSAATTGQNCPQTAKPRAKNNRRRRKNLHCAGQNKNKSTTGIKSATPAGVRRIIVQQKARGNAPRFWFCCGLFVAAQPK